MCMIYSTMSQILGKLQHTAQSHSIPHKSSRSRKHSKHRQRIQENVKIIVHNMAFIQHTKISIKTQLLNQKRESIFQKLARYHLIIVIYRSILVHKFRKLEKIVKNN